MIVCDLGCCPHDGDLSIEPLIERFRPETLYGFDPLAEPRYYYEGQTQIVIENAAAWTYTGTAELGIGAPQMLDATLVPAKNDRGEWQRTQSVACIDFSRWLYLNGPAVVKMNIEGAEFPLLAYLIETSADLLISRLIVSWHDERMGWTSRRRRLEAALHCPVEEWSLRVSA